MQETVILQKLLFRCWCSVTTTIQHYTLTHLRFVVVSSLLGVMCYATADTSALSIKESVRACVIQPHLPLTQSVRQEIAVCLGWHPEPCNKLRCGYYDPLTVTSLAEAGNIQILADQVSFNQVGYSTLRGHVEIQQTQRIVSAQTATIYRNPKTNQITQIELLGNVHYLEPGRLLIAKSATINPQDKSGHVTDAIYRFDTTRAGATLPAWGRALWIQRFANQNYLLKKVTYSTCAPEDRAWQIEANSIYLDQASQVGVAKNATLRIHDWPLLYTPYLSFPTSKQRKSGFLMPMVGYSNIGGFDVAVPYYFNLAPNYDATFVPHLYTFRGLMLGGDFRFLTQNSSGIVGGTYLPHDAAFNKFLMQNRDEFPALEGVSSDRWSAMLREKTMFTPNLAMDINFQQVSDDYYLQDFSSNLAVTTENQILREGHLTYSTEHWAFNGMLQSYQTLHPINQSEIADIYQRLPQLLAEGSYSNLPFNSDLHVRGQFDYFQWPGNNWPGNTFKPPEGARYHLNPILSVPQIKPWGYITPEVQFVENNYDLNYQYPFYSRSFNRFIPRYSVDSGLTFERDTLFQNRSYMQTLEPRLFYLYVPYQNQSEFPAFDSAYMIFNVDQLFRTNRFSGFDRIGDTNQLSYALTSRWFSSNTGREKASVSVGQIRYFQNRRVQLCYSPNGQCEDNPFFLGYLSPDSSSSPIASRAIYELNPAWVASGDYVWDPATHATNNGYLNLHYQPNPERIINFGYSYLVNGNLFVIPTTGVQNNPLHQATVSYAWPVTERWSSLGVYSYNISENYGMMYFLGLQYDTCCWAARLLGGRTFRSLTSDTLSPQYNNNVYFQVLLKGLGSAATSDPATIIQSYLPGYVNIFQH